MRSTIKYFFPNRLWQFLLMALVAVAPMMAVMSLMVDGGVSFEAQTLVVSFIFAILVTIISWVVNKKRGIEIRSYYTLHFTHWQYSFAMIAVYVLMVSIPANAMIVQRDTLLTVGNVVSMGLLAPVLEEWLFRGLWLRGMLDRYPPLTAIGITSVVFALIHGQSWQILFALPLGMLLGYVFYRTHNLVYTILLHATNNLLVLFCASWLRNFLAGSIWLAGCIVVLGVALTVWLLNQRFLRLFSTFPKK